MALHSKMELVQPHTTGSMIEETISEEPCPLGSLDINDIIAKPQMIPRVGNEYQVEIPSMVNNFKQNLTEASYLPHMDLTMPCMWVYIDNSHSKDQRSVSPFNIDDAKGSVESRNRKKSRITYKRRGSQSNDKAADDLLDLRKDLSSADSGLKMEGKTNRSYCLVPGSPCGPWSDAESDFFLLGLYIFGKNFNQIERFIENKAMGDILSFYYEKFCKSNGHCRWSDCRKSKSKKYVSGKKIFLGWRQQELLSRLLPHVSETAQSKLLQISKSFAEEKISLEEYAFSLKAAVGLYSLVKAVGIGKGKEDLTGNAMEPVCPKVPTGKACSSLTSGDIIKFLTGGFPLSKARRNDIFWEAVWPRLLARGWHSEQPKDQGYIGSKHYLVFLKPGIKKFSRGRLVKGKDFFDSIGDVLSQVISEPQLIELEAEGVRVDGLKQVIVCPEVKSDEEDLLAYKCHHYLKPRLSICQMKFTIVDTSLNSEGKPFKVRELRDSQAGFRLSRPLEFGKGNSFENSLDTYKHVPAVLHLNSEKNIQNANHCDGMSKSNDSDALKFDIIDTSSVPAEKAFQLRGLKCLPVDLTLEETDFVANKRFPTEGLNSEGAFDKPIHALKHKERDVSVDYTVTGIGSHMEQETNISEDKQSKRSIKIQFTRRVKPSPSNPMSPLIKRRRLTACDKPERVEIIDNVSESIESKQQEPCCGSSSQDAGENLTSPAGNGQEQPSMDCSPEVEARGQIVFHDHGSNGGVSHTGNVKPKCMTLIDPYLSQAKLASEDTVMLKTERDCKGKEDGTDLQPPFTSNKPLDGLDAQRTDVGTGIAEEHLNVISRRQSTRNRPLTAKAMEALASGFYNMGKKRKNYV